MQPRAETVRPHLAIIVLSFVASVVLAGVISWFAFGDSGAGVILFCCPLSCALPIFAVLTGILRKVVKRGILGSVLPLLVFPLLFILLLAYMVYQRNPQIMFKAYLADPIPAGVTNIQGRYIQQGLTDDVVITFQAPRETIDTIIALNHFERNKVEDGHPDRDLLEYSWKGNWIGYTHEFIKESGGLAGYTHLWVDPDQSIVIFRYTYSGW